MKSESLQGALSCCWQRGQRPPG